MIVSRNPGECGPVLTLTAGAEVENFDNMLKVIKAPWVMRKMASTMNYGKGKEIVEIRFEEETIFEVVRSLKTSYSEITIGQPNQTMSRPTGK